MATRTTIHSLSVCNSSRDSSHVLLAFRGLPSPVEPQQDPEAYKVYAYTPFC